MKYINKEDYKNQKEIVLEHIKKYGNISTLEGYNQYQIMRIGSVINQLRNDGYKIQTVLEYNKNKSKRYARYYLMENGK